LAHYAGRLLIDSCIDKEVRLASRSKREKIETGKEEDVRETAIRDNVILHRDCLEAMAALPEGSVDLAFADPPFNIGYEYDVYDDQQDREAYLDWSHKWIAAVHRVLKPSGTFWLAIGDEYAAELKLIAQRCGTGIPACQMGKTDETSAQRSKAGKSSSRARKAGKKACPIGFHCRSWVVWYYTFGVNCKYKFTRSHAHLFYFVKDPEQFTFHDAAIRVPSARQLVYADGRANPAGRLPDDTWILRPQDLTNGFTAEEDTWYFPRVAGTFKERAGFHGCQMPEQLLGRIIRACSNPGELVLDPFSGSATTLAVAKKLGRRWLGFDLSEEYVERGIARLERTREGDPLDGAPEPLVSAPATAEGKSLTDGRRRKRRVFARRSPATLFDTGDDSQ
jgi:site-specific DNA-methyltransferase (adenine-specific)